MVNDHQGVGCHDTAVGRACDGTEWRPRNHRAGEHCPPAGGQSIVITVGDIDCVTATDYAAQYDLAGDKYQQIGPFTCYSGNAMTAPLIFQCVADTEDTAEFGVYPA